MRRALIPVTAAFAIALTSCWAAVGPGVMDVDDGYPPDAYVATSAPVYYEGHPAYWWGNRWYFRDGARWHAYREEPAHLREYRARTGPVRHYYGRANNSGYRHRG